MVEVVIAIIVLLIIAFFAIYNSQNSVPQAKLTEVYSEMKSVQAAVEFVNMNMVTNENFTLEIGKHYDQLSDGNYIIYGVLKHGSIQSAERLGINNLKRDYIVNYEDCTFELLEAVDINGTEVKTLSEVESMIDGGIK